MSGLRFTIRWMMVAVAVAALGLGGIVLLHRASLYRITAERFRDTEKLWLKRVVDSMVAHELWLERRNDNQERQLRLHYGFEGTPPTEAELLLSYRDFQVKGKLAVAFYEGLASKYERAARFPWMLVEPDPPQPD